MQQHFSPVLDKPLVLRIMWVSVGAFEVLVPYLGVCLVRFYLTAKDHD